MEDNSKLNQLEFTDKDFIAAHKIAAQLGYGQNTAYTSGSALIGLFCFPLDENGKRGVIIKTAELGFLFVQDLEDLGIS